MLGHSSFIRLLILPLVAAFVAACEAPLNLEQVAAEQDKQLRRYDMFQAGAATQTTAVVVSSTGAAIVSSDMGNTWQRMELAGRPALIDVTACPSGALYALDSERHLWRFGEQQWQSEQIDTPENTLSVHCAPDNRLWVSASFSTLYSRAAGEQQWREFSLYEDLQFTAVRFINAEQGFAVGEFGTVIATTDGGETWEPKASIPNEFYPMAADFVDAQTGWVGGLSGVIWQTEDGGNSWQRQRTPTPTPVYNILASESGVFAVGGSAKLVELEQGKWQPLTGAPPVLAYIRALAELGDGSLLVAGGAGTLAVIKGDQQ